MLGDEELTHRSEDASNVFTLMAIVTSISFLLYTLDCGLSAASSLCSVLVLCVILYLRVLSVLSTQMSDVLEKCEVFEKALQLSVHDQHDALVKIKYRKEFRSRYAKFVSFNDNRECHVPSRRCDREPSRIPVKKLKSLSQKSRKLRLFVWERVLKQTPLSSKLHRYIKSRLRRTRTTKRPTVDGRFVQRVRKKPASVRRKLRQTPLPCFKRYTGRRKQVNLKKYQLLYTCSGLVSMYKNGNHTGCCAMFKLRNDIETNPGPPIHHVDPTLTMKAPYSQGDVTVFGANAGQQCVAMSLCALVYNNIKGINSCNDLVQIMNMGNELYSILSQSTGQSYLMLTELPSMISMLEENYQLKFSESYTGNAQNDAIIEGYQYCMPMDRAFESLLSENYRSFILTVGFITVGIYCTDTGKFKIFDSHARDAYGKSHPQGTCVLLEVPSIQNLVEYFQGVHANGEVYELRGVQVFKYGINEPLSNDSEATNSSCKQSCALGLYAICYSLIKPASYWNASTLAFIAKYGDKFNCDMEIDRHQTCGDLCGSVQVCGAEISVVLNTQSHGMLSFNSQETKRKLETLILGNYCKNTGFLLWLSSYCITCIFRQTARAKYTFSLLTYDDTCEPAIQQNKGITGISSLVEAIANIAQNKFKSEHVHYKIQFLSCTCGVDKCERKKLMQKCRLKHTYDSMEPATKKKIRREENTLCRNVHNNGSSRKETAI